MFKTLLFTILLVVAAWMGWQLYLLQSVSPFHEGIFQLELASKIHGSELLRSWQAMNYGGKTMLNIAKGNTHSDFILILIYTLLIWLLSYLQMQHERAVFWNELLRANLVVVFLAAIFDCTENVLLLYNIHHLGEVGRYGSSYWISLIKFVLLGWSVMIYLVSLTRTQLFNL